MCFRRKKKTSGQGILPAERGSSRASLNSRKNLQSAHENQSSRITLPPLDEGEISSKTAMTERFEEEFKIAAKPAPIKATERSSFSSASSLAMPSPKFADRKVEGSLPDRKDPQYQTLCGLDDWSTKGRKSDASGIMITDKSSLRVQPIMKGTAGELEQEAQGV